MRLGALLLVPALLAGVMVVAPATPALACSCAGEPLADYADEVALAFTGSQVDREEVSRNEPKMRLTFDVDQVFSGDVAATVTVRTDIDGDSCGTDFAGMGVTGVAAFAHEDEVVVTLCGSHVSTADLEAVFGPGAEPSAVPDDLGGVESEDEMSIAIVAVVLVAGVALVAGTVALVRRRRLF